MAYVDGELDADARRAFESALAGDPVLAQRVRAQQAVRDRLRAAFASDLDEPVPERLSAALRRPAVPAANGAKVADLDAARQARATRRRTPADWRWPEWGALAASLVLGLLGGRLAWTDDAPFGAGAGSALVARGALADALTTQLASAPRAGAAVRVGVSFVDRDGAYCRSFVMDSRAAMAGLACRVGAQWQLQLLAPAAGASNAASGAYRTASAELPAVLLNAIDARISGAALDAAGERDAARRGWQR
jgi:hypothetical protein